MLGKFLFYLPMPFYHPLTWRSRGSQSEREAIILNASPAACANRNWSVIRNSYLPVRAIRATAKRIDGNALTVKLYQDEVIRLRDGFKAEITGVVERVPT